MAHSIREKPVIKRLLKAFYTLEVVFSIIVALTLAGVLGYIVYRIIVFSYILFFARLKDPTLIVSADFNNFFGKVIVMLITVELINTILGAVRSGTSKSLAKDVILISGLAIARKLIVIEFNDVQPFLFLSLGILMLGLGGFYMMITTRRLSALLPSNNFLKVFRRKNNNHPEKKPVPLKNIKHVAHH